MRPLKDIEGNKIDWSNTLLDILVIILLYLYQYYRMTKNLRHFDIRSETDGTHGEIFNSTNCV
jgi:hypothetical protein